MDALPLAALIVLVLLALAGAAAGIVLAIGGSTPPPGRSATRSDPGLLRLTAELHTGWEQTLIGLSRELGLPRQVGDVAYGNLYLQTDSEQRVLIRSRSEIGRGFIGVTDLHTDRRVTRVRYSIRRLPGDDQVRGRVLELEVRLVAALRRIDPDAIVQLTGTAQHELDTTAQHAPQNRMPFSD